MYIHMQYICIYTCNTHVYTKKEQKMGNLKDKATTRQARTEAVKKENETIDYISGERKTEQETIALYQKPKTLQREKAISARVNGEMFDRFKDICRQKDMTANAALNMLIEEYVMKNKG